MELLEKIISDAQGALWQDTTVPVRLQPRINGDNWHYSSDLPLRLASLIRLSPEKIVGDLMSYLHSAHGLSCHSENGFLHIPLDDLPVKYTLGANFQSKPALRKFTVIVVSENNEFVRARLLASAIMQLKYLNAFGQNAQLINCGVKISQNGSINDFFNSFRTGLANPSEGSQLQKWLTEELEQGKDDQIFLWISPFCFPPSYMAEFLRTTHRLYPEAIVNCPERSWLYTKSKVALPPIASSFNKDNIAAFFCLLAGPIEAKEMDLTVALLQESENLPWFISSLCQRLAEVPTSARDFGSAEEKAVFKRLHNLLGLIGDFAWVGASLGQVAQFLTVLSYLARELNRMLNKPSFRLRWHLQTLSPEESEFLARARSILQDMLTLLR